METFEIIIGSVVIAMGIFYIYTGISGKFIYLKIADEESSEEMKEKKIQQVRRRNRIIGVVAILVGIAAILVSTVWAS